VWANRRSIAWSATIFASALPGIIWRESGHRSVPWIALTQCIVLVLAALALLLSPGRKDLARFVFALAAWRVGWYFAAPWIESTSLVRGWLEQGDWGVELMIGRATLLAGAALMSLTLIGSGISRRDLFLCRGNLAASAQPIPFLWPRKPLAWTLFGPALLVIFGFALPLFLYFTVRPDFTAGARILHFAPWILAVAALNAANEEFQFRCVLLAQLRHVLAPSAAVFLTSVLFGLGHYYGQPSGPIGVVMAGIAGWIWARRMIETRGFAWAFLIHFVQDIVIFSFLAVGTTR